MGQFAITSDMGFTRGIALLDDCEGTCSWSGSGTGADWVAEYATAASWMGTKGLHLKTRADGAAENDTVQGSRRLAWPESGVFVLRTWLASPDVSDVKEIEFGIWVDDGDDRYRARVGWWPASMEVFYRSAASGWVAPGIESGPVGDGQWSTMEIVLDCDEREWVSLRMFGQKIDMRGLAMYPEIGSGSFREITVLFYVYAAGAAAAEGYFDQVYIGEHMDLWN